MNLVSNISFRTKLTIAILLLSLLSAIGIIYSVYENGKQKMTENVFTNLTAIRVAKKQQIEEYFSHTSSIVKMIGDNPTIFEATRAFKKGFQDIKVTAEQISCRDSLSTYYSEYIDRLEANITIEPDIEIYYPTSNTACYLQYEYIVDNPFPLGEKNKFLTSADGTPYDAAHQKYHEYLHSLIEEFGFYDIFLVDLATGDIVYTAFKEADFATNLYTGPYSQSNFADLVRKINQNRDMKTATTVDFASYRPSYGAAASFMGIPLKNGQETIGALVVQLPTDKIDRVMTSNQNWSNVGLGETGETYLIGEDYLMRSISRFYLEDTLDFSHRLTHIGFREEQVNNMYKVGSTTLQLRVKTEASEEALLGKTDTKIVNDYRGVPVLSSYSPLQIQGLNWALLSEMDYAEANKSINSFKNSVFITLALILLTLTFLATWIADYLIRPVEQLKVGFKQLNEGTIQTLPVDGRSEFTQLTNKFNDLIATISHHDEQVQTVKNENERLLFNFMPQMIAKRMQEGEKNIIETYSNASLIIVDIDDYSKLTEVMDEKEAFGYLNELINAFDVVAEQHHVDKIRTMGDNYYGSCGLFSPRMDHAKRIVDFAIDLNQIIEQFNKKNKLDLSLIIAINAGPITSGLIGDENFSYDLLGPTVDTLFDMKNLEKSGDIIVAQSIYEKTKDFFDYELLTEGNHSELYKVKTPTLLAVAMNGQ